MGLHRDIFWLGRQWAVTGDGLQLIDQRLEGFFDIEVSRLWEDAAIEGVQARQWLNRADFDEGLERARTRFPKPQRFLEGSAPLPRQPQPAAPVGTEQPPPDVGVSKSSAAPVPVTRFESIGLRAHGLGSAQFQRSWRVLLQRR